MTLSENVLEKPAELMLDHRFPNQKPSQKRRQKSLISPNLHPPVTPRVFFGE
jgi:hypothetical protein